MRLGLLKASLNYQHDIIKGLSLGDIELEFGNIIPVLMSVMIQGTHLSPFYVVSSDFLGVLPLENCFT